MEPSSTLVHSKSRRESGRSSLIRSKQLAKTWSENSMPMLGNRRRKRGSLTPTQQWSIMPTTNRLELMVERAVLIHSIIIGENINVEEIIAKQFYKFIYKTDLASSLPFPSIIAALCADAKVPAIKDDNMIPQEPAIVGAAMLRTRETRARQARQEAPPPQQQPQMHLQP
ncbi:hypothetical protein PIB30_050346 [Stylosanthes scabra]|uniref:Putative plant transposon protein domain-containing protein n=1 Tax=Stylosanthes scabra TaxID=79078 RepID=A0ABU6WH78_9FABA|nr:hypothetical protein [Stylosanthes scabra]